MGFVATGNESVFRVAGTSHAVIIHHIFIACNVHVLTPFELRLKPQFETLVVLSGV
jgi:hypothetical protein